MIPLLAEWARLAQSCENTSARDGEMKRLTLLACAGVLLGACASGADVADEADASPDSAVVETLEGPPPQAPSQPKDAQP
jgi:hypothetical protein